MAKRQFTPQQVLACIMELQNNNKKPHRQTISSVLGAPLGIVDDHIKTLQEQGAICRTGPGEVATVKIWRKDEPISVTYLEEGEVLVEKGDVKLDFTPSEWRKLSQLSMGSQLAFSLAKV